MMTEAEAKKKWCPHIRITTGVHDSMSITNRCDTPTMTDCIASECMAWRWGGGKLTKEQFDELRADGLSIFEAAQWQKDNVESTTHGYCGLAGKP